MAVANPRRRRMLIVLPAVVVSIAGFALALAVPGRGTGDTTEVVAAQTTLDASAKIASGDLKFVPLPTSQVTPGVYFTDPNTVVGQYLAVKVPAGTPLVSSMVVPDTAPAAVVRNKPLDIKAGDVALSIPFDDARGVGGFVQPEDHLDVLVSVNGVLRYGIQDVRVLRVGAADQATGAAPTVLVVELPRTEAAVLTYLLSAPGNNAVVKYALRPHDAYGTGPISGPDVNADNWPQFLAH